MPKVSIIVPIYKVENYIERNVRSLMEQTLCDIEYIFVDDGSPDRSVEILRQTLADYPERINHVQILTHKVNKGLTAARNTGLAVARGKFIAHCDSDDWVHPQMYETLYKKAMNESADLAYCNFNFVYPAKIVPWNTAKIFTNKQKLLSTYIRSTWTVLWNIIAHRELYEKYNLRSPEGISYCEDFHLAVRLFYYANKIAKVDQPLYYYNQLNNTSIVHNLNRKAESNERWVYLDIIRFFKEKGVLEEYHKEMCWRVLKSKQEAILAINRHNEFLELYPNSHSYIWNCPFINNKLKIMMWCLTHHMSWITYAIIYARNLKEILIRK